MYEYSSWQNSPTSFCFGAAGVSCQDLWNHLKSDMEYSWRRNWSQDWTSVTTGWGKGETGGLGETWGKGETRGLSLLTFSVPASMVGVLSTFWVVMPEAVDSSSETRAAEKPDPSSEVSMVGVLFTSYYFWILVEWNHHSNYSKIFLIWNDFTSESCIFLLNNVLEWNWISFHFYILTGEWFLKCTWIKHSWKFYSKKMYSSCSQNYSITNLIINEYDEFHSTFDISSLVFHLF